MDTKFDGVGRVFLKDFPAAASRAYRLASHWGGDYAVFKDAQDHYMVLNPNAGIAAGLAIIGCASSPGAMELSWRWMDGRQAEPPTSPFAVNKSPRPLRALIYSLTAPERSLVDLMNHVLKIQLKFSRCEIIAARQLLNSTPNHLPDDCLVPHEAYLARVRSQGAVEREISRLEDLLASARDVIGQHNMLDKNTRRSEAIIFGREPARPRAAEISRRPKAESNAGRRVTLHPSEEALEQFTTGECHVLALALHRAYGLKIMAVVDYSEPYSSIVDDNGDKGEDIPSVIHVYAVDAAGMAWDIRGARPADRKAIMADITEAFPDLCHCEGNLSTEDWSEDDVARHSANDDMPLFHYGEADIGKALGIFNASLAACGLIMNCVVEADGLSGMEPSA